MEMSHVLYASVVSSLMFDMASLGKEHLSNVKKNLKIYQGYLKCCIISWRIKIFYWNCVDLDFAADIGKNKFSTGHVFTLAKGAISWVSKWQSSVATLTMEAEYFVVTQASKEATRLQMLVEELRNKQENIAILW